MAERGFGQAEVDDMELWVIAEVLGVHLQDSAPQTVADHRRDAKAWNKARVAAAAAGKPLAERPPPTGPVVSEDMVQALRERRQQRTQGAPTREAGGDLAG